jgi:hypothetical protein
MYTNFRNVITFLAVLKLDIKTPWSCQVVLKHAGVTEDYLCVVCAFIGLVQEN